MYWNYCSKKGLHSIYSNKINYIHEYLRLPFLLEKYQILYYFLNLMTPAEDSSARTNLHVYYLYVKRCSREIFIGFFHRKIYVLEMFDIMERLAQWHFLGQSVFGPPHPFMWKTINCNILLKQLLPFQTLFYSSDFKIFSTQHS
jgi:hypothetical protein